MNKGAVIFIGVSLFYTAFVAVMAYLKSKQKKAPEWVLEWATNNPPPVHVTIFTNGQRIEVKIHNTKP